MVTTAQTPADDELHLLTQWGDPYSRKRTERAAVLSVVVHVCLIVGLAFVPEGAFKNPPRVVETHRIVTPLVEPLTELTQKAPNTGKISKEISASEIQPRPRVQVPAAVPAPKPAARKLAELSSMPAPKPAAPMALPEAPKVESATKEAPKSVLPQAAAPPPLPPQIQVQENPKLALENPTPAPTGGPTRALPDTSVAGAIRQTVRGSAGGGLVVGDPEAAGSAGYGAGMSVAPSPGSQASALQLLSNPMGVDFRPYLMRILASVKQHWRAVMPESARYGRQGKVAIQFYINRDGGVPKLVIATSSGARALDEAAVAGISASNPFPPLPTEYKGDRIQLQFNFAYNMPKQ